MKSQPEKRYVVDVSDLIHWRGHLSGIQRVVAEMAYRYEKEGAVFCYYEEATKQFYPLESFSSHMNQRQETQRTEAQQPSGTPVNTSKAIAAKMHLKRATKGVTPPIATKVARYIRREIEDSFAGRTKTDTRERFEFKNGDVLLVFGGHWDKPHYTEVLRFAKQQAKIRIAHLIHDLIPIYDQAHVSEEEHVRFPLYIKEISELSDIIYVTSEASKRDYARFLKENNVTQKPAVHKVTLGENFRRSGAIKPEGFGASTYILAVGTFEVRKNYGLLYATYKRAHEHKIHLPQLVIVGRRGWLSSDIHYQIEHDSEVSDDILLMHNVSDGELEWLYDHSLFTVQPSFSEGWGLPVAEAAHYGKVCAVSNVPPLPEVVGDSALYFSPYSADECLAVIHQLLDEKVRMKLEKKLTKRQPASWDMTFHKSKEAL